MIRGTITRAICIKILLLIPVLGWTQDSLVMNLGECVNYAFQESFELKSIEYEELITEQNTRVLRTKLLPLIGVSSNVVEYVQDSRVVFADNILPESNVSGARTFNMSASVNTNIDLLRFGGAITELKSDFYQKAAQGHLNQERKNQVILDICRGYYDCAITQYQVRAISDKIEDSKKLLEIAKLRVDVGEADSTQYLQASINLQKDLIALQSAKLNKEGKLNNLKILIGIPLKKELRIDSSITSSPENIGVLSAIVDSEMNHEVLAIEKSLMSLRYSAKKSIWDAFPEVAIYGGYGYSDQLFQNGIVQQNSALGYSLGAGISYDIGSTKNAIHQRKIYKLNSSIAELELDKENAAAQARLNELESRREQYRQIVQANRSVLQMAERNLRNSKASFSLGLLRLSELRDVQDQLIEAQLDLKRSFADLHLCKMEIKAFSGDLHDYFELKNN